MAIQQETAIVGVANTSFTAVAQRSVRAMAVEAIHNAVQDAGLDVDDIDGLVSYTFDPIAEFEILNAFGWKDLKFFGKVPYGNASGAVALAAMGIATGQARHVAVFRSVAAPTGHAYRYSGPMDKVGPTYLGGRAHYAPYGLSTPCHWAAITAQRYLHTFGADPLAFGWITVGAREHASRNPHALLTGQALSIEAYERAPFVASPLRAVDCTTGGEGASAVIVASVERAKDLAKPLVRILATAQGTGSNAEALTSYNRPEITFAEECQSLAAEIFDVAGVSRADVDFAELSDDVSSSVLMALEGLGFCGRGEGPDFVSGATRITVGGELPINTHGGHLGEANIETMNHIVEAARQIRGEAPVQVPDARIGLVVSGSGFPSSALILGR